MLIASTLKLVINRHKIHHHFLPHFFAAPEFADEAASLSRNSVHHRAHALSPLALFAYLQILIVFCLSLYAIGLKAPQVLGTVTFSADQIITLTNQKRAEYGLPALTYNSKLAKAAGAKAANMFLENYWAHNSPSGKTPWSFISAAGYKYIFAGENLARDFDNPSAVVNAWMNSPTHRDNLLDKNFAEIGVAVSYGKLTGREGILVVQEFGAGAATKRAQVRGDSLELGDKEATSPGVPVVLQDPDLELAIFQDQSYSSPAPTTVLASRQFSVAKGVSFLLVMFIFVLFLAEVLITLRRENVNLRPGVLAHILLLAFVLFALWYAVGGAVL